MKILKFDNMGDSGHIVEIDGTLASLQKEVDGYIEAIYPFNEDLALICNDEGKFNGMKANKPLYYEGQLVDIVYGPFFICGCDTENFTDFPEELTEEIKNKFKTNW